MAERFLPREETTLPPRRVASFPVMWRLPALHPDTSGRSRCVCVDSWTGCLHTLPRISDCNGSSYLAPRFPRMKERQPTGHPVAVPAVSSARLDSIDLLRGLVMVLM